MVMQKHKLPTVDSGAWTVDYRIIMFLSFLHYGRNAVILMHIHWYITNRKCF